MKRTMAIHGKYAKALSLAEQELKQLRIVVKLISGENNPQIPKKHLKELVHRITEQCDKQTLQQIVEDVLYESLVYITEQETKELYKEVAL